MVSQDINHVCESEDRAGYYPEREPDFHLVETSEFSIVIVYPKEKIKYLFKELGEIIPIFHSKAKEKLENDIALLFTTYKLIVKLNEIKPKDLSILEIRLGKDPEISDWQPIEILVTIKSNDHKYVFDTIYTLINKVYESFNPDDVREIDIIDVPYIKRMR